MQPWGTNTPGHAKQAYLPMKPTGVATLFLASALELRTNAQGIICVYRGRECIGLGEVSEFFFVPPLLMGCCEVHTIRVGMAPPPQAESTQRDRVSGVRRRSRGRSCKTDARMLVAATLAGKISLTPRFARRCRCLRHTCARREMTATFGETISHLRSRSNRVCRIEPPYSSTHSLMAGCRSFACYVSPHLLYRFAVRRCSVHGAERADRPLGSRIHRYSTTRRALLSKVPPLARTRPASARARVLTARVSCSHRAEAEAARTGGDTGEGGGRGGERGGGGRSHRRRRACDRGGARHVDGQGAGHGTGPRGGGGDQTYGGRRCARFGSVWLSLISHASVCLSHALVSQHERSGRSHVQNERDFEISISPPTLARELYVCTFLKGSVSCE